jgi:hypothetical protein
MNISLTLGVIAIACSILVSGVLFYIFKTFKDLVKLTKEKEYINTVKDLKELRSDFENFKKISKLDLQKIGLTRFNSFKEAGGDNSFSLTLLDGHKNGIIITSLHTRERTRLYIKDVNSGKVNIKLSDEEGKSLKKALEK